MSPRPPIDHIRKPQILAAAAEVITERGLIATRIADVAERAGTSPSAVLYWFGTREELLKAALVAEEKRWAEDLGAQLAQAGGAGSRLRLLIERTAAEPDLSLWIELWARSLHDRSAAEDRLRLDRDWCELIASLIAAGQAEGCFSEELDAGEIAVLIAAMLDGLSVQATLDREEMSTVRMKEMALRGAEAILGTSLAPLEAELGRAAG
jgi:AcrR family transcriptional regulator